MWFFCCFGSANSLFLSVKWFNYDGGSALHYADIHRITSLYCQVPLSVTVVGTVKDSRWEATLLGWALTENWRRPHLCAKEYLRQSDLLISGYMTQELQIRTNLSWGCWACSAHVGIFSWCIHAVLCLSNWLTVVVVVMSCLISSNGSLLCADWRSTADCQWFIKWSAVMGKCCQ